MTIRISLQHETRYDYDRAVTLGPQVVRLRPAAHCRTPIRSYSLKIDPPDHYLNWQQDPHGNFLARLVFREPTKVFAVRVDLTADLVSVNPFDFFVEEQAERFPFEYEPALARDLRPFLECEPAGPELTAYLEGIDRKPSKTVDFLVQVNYQLQSDIDYLVRMEPGVQSCEETLAKRSGSCRDSAWLLVQILRRIGLAARFVSGYLVQLAADVKPLEGPEGPTSDFTDLHAWVEVYLPGGGWIGLDPTSGLFAGEGHIPLAATPDPQTAAPITGAVEACEVKFGFEMSVTRVYESPRVTKPIVDEQWERIDRLGELVDQQLADADVRLTMGGEPTFVSIDDMEGEQWNTGAVGRDKRAKSIELVKRLRKRFAPGGLLHFGQGKWYPGESLPRWSDTILFRADGEPIWNDEKLLAEPSVTGPADDQAAHEFMQACAENLGVVSDWIVPAYEDPWQTIAEERRLPVDFDIADVDPDDPEDRVRLARIIELGVGRPRGYVMPLSRAWWQARANWVSGPWPLRSEVLFLIPGDSPVGLRLPLKSLPTSTTRGPFRILPADPTVPREPLPEWKQLRQQAKTRRNSPPVKLTDAPPAATAQSSGGPSDEPDSQSDRSPDRPDADGTWSASVSTALCVEPRDGHLHVFIPPVSSADDFLDLVATIEETAAELSTPVVIEGYLPPSDARLNVIKVTPDPGVIEVNIHPGGSWRELVEITEGLYEDARQTRLGTEKFELDGRHTGTGGGNHIVLGGATPLDSPFLRRPDVLRSMLAYWNNHPALSYLFSGMFVGPTSQAPRVDESRLDATYELQLAFDQLPASGPVAPWVVDRLFRHLLTDVTGNTHRAEVCIDKLYSPDSATGRLGLVELRSFEMPPHPRMSLLQQLLVRALVMRFWSRPYTCPLAAWRTSLHDRFMLPYFLEQDLVEIVDDLRANGFPFEASWFAAQLEFRCPQIGEIQSGDVRVEIRQAIEPWYVLGEEPAGGGTARYVDSSLERVQVRVQGLSERFTVTCNGRQIPLTPTGTVGERVGAVRFRAWQPPNCLHPTIGVHTPLMFDIVDQWDSRSVAGATYYVEHPGGLNPSSYPVNAREAESRRAARFSRIGFTGGRVELVPERIDPHYPLTLDLRRSRGD